MTETKKEIPRRRNGFYYLDENRIYPSVTTILQILAKPALVSWAAKEAARAALADPTLSEQEAAGVIWSKRGKASDRGRAIHSFAEVYQQGGHVEIDQLPPEFQGYAKAFVSWIESFKPKIIHRETEIHSDQFCYAGTLDMILEDMRGEKWLVDIKTSSDIYPEMGLQLVAYKMAVEEMKLAKIDKTAILLLGEDGAFKFCEVTGDFNAFLAAKTLFLWKDNDRVLASKPKKKNKKGDEE